MTVLKLAWQLLPPVDDPPRRTSPGQEHLSFRCRPLVVPADDHVLLWGGSYQGQPLPNAAGLLIGADGRVRSHFEVEWAWGDQATVIDEVVVVCGPGADGHDARAVVFDPTAPDCAGRYLAPLACRGYTTPVRFCRGMAIWGGENRPEPPLPKLRRWFSDGAVFDLDKRTWALLPATPIGERSWPVVQAVDDHLVIWGGIPGRDAKRDIGALNDGAVYDRVRDTWRSMAPSPLSPRYGASAAVVDGQVFIWGGAAGGRYFGDAALYDPHADQWSLLPPAPARGSGASIIAVGGVVVMAGGTYGGGRDVQLLVYDARTNTWQCENLDDEFVPGTCSFAALDEEHIYTWSCSNPTTEHAILHVRRESGPAAGITGARRSSPILWSMQGAGADGMVATDTAVIVVASEWVTAYERYRGAHLWTAEMTSTDGWTPAVVTATGVLVVRGPSGSTAAFGVSNGRSVPVPPDVEFPSHPPRRIAGGYRAEGRKLYYGDRLIWTKGRGHDGAGSLTDETTVARVGDLTVINDFREGLRVVDDEGTVLAAPQMGSREYDERTPLVSGTTALAVTADGVLYAITSS